MFAGIKFPKQVSENILRNCEQKKFILVAYAKLRSKKDLKKILKIGEN
jgi:hypothetical protein